MNKYLSLLVVCALAFSGCTKNKGTKTTKKKNGKESTKVAANDVQGVNSLAFADGAQSQEDLVASSKNVQNEIDQLISLWEEETPAADKVADASLKFDAVNFDLNRSKINDTQELALQKDIESALAAIDQGKELVVKGHACQTGPASFNLALSQKRADAVRSRLIKAGAPAEKVKAVGCGSEFPLVSSTATDRATLVKELSANRRSEIEVL